MKLQSHPDNVEFDCLEGESVLAAAERARLAFAHACGGRAKCSTCRIWVLDGLGNCPARLPEERLLADRLALSEQIRLACQLRPVGPVRFRRLVLDETDLAITSQLNRSRATRTGELKKVAIFFSDIVGFTQFSQNLTPYDVMYLLNRYFAQVGQVIEDNFGYIDKFVGDGLMAVFGIDDRPDAPLRAVAAGLASLAVVDRMRPFFAGMYEIDFNVRIGVHYGEAVIGSIGSPGTERITAIGDAVNVASRVETANKDAGTRFLISEDLHEEVKGDVVVSDFVRVRLRGTSDRTTLYEIEKLTEDAQHRLHQRARRDTRRHAGRDWTCAMEEGELADGEYRVLEFPELDVVVVRIGDLHHAFNNACPHLKLPFFDRRTSLDDPSKLRGDASLLTRAEIECRWHRSCFDLSSGEIVRWCDALNDDGTSTEMAVLGDISKNRGPLHVLPCQVEDGRVWVSLG